MPENRPLCGPHDSLAHVDVRFVEALQAAGVDEACHFAAAAGIGFAEEVISHAGDDLVEKVA